MYKVIIVSLLILAGCFTAPIPAGSYGEPARQQSSPHEQEPEYQEGLSKTLEAAPTVYAASVLKQFYDFGYSAGILESGEWRMNEMDEHTEVGCVAILPDLINQSGFQGLSLCKAIRPFKGKYTNSKMGGAIFQSSRLSVVRKGTELNDQNIASMLIFSFENGYAMGFQHGSENGDPLEEMRVAVSVGCLKHIRHYMSTNELTTKCQSIGNSYVQSFLENMNKINN